MYNRLFIGNKLIQLDEVDSTNTYLQNLINNNEKEIEGVVVVADNQCLGRGQRGNSWSSESGRNLMFSIFLKPAIEVENQFLISKICSLGVIDFLKNKGLDNVKIKWPNDIYFRNKKLSGILIENSIKGNKIANSIIGVGVNVNQTKFSSSLTNPISLKKVLGEQLDLRKSLDELLFFIEKRYLALKAKKYDLIDAEYLNYLYWKNERRSFQVNGKRVEGIIIGVESIGRLQVEIDQKIEVFDLKEIEFLE